MIIFGKIFSFLERNPIVSLILIGLPALISFFYILLFGVNVVYWDQWELVPYLDKLFQNTLTITDLFSQHNEHRIFFPRIVMLAIAYLTHYNTIAEMLFGWVILFIACIILFLIFRKNFGTSPETLPLFIPIAWLLFSTKQWENLLWGWQIQIFLCSMGFLLSVYCLEKVEKIDLYFLLAILGGIISTFSFFNGLLVWLAGICYLLMKNKSRTVLITWIGISAVIYGLFFYHWSRPAYHPSPIYILHDPSGGIIYFIANIGSGLSGGFGDAPVSIISGIIALIFGTIILLTISYGFFLNYRYNFFKQNASWWTLIAFSLMTSIVLTIGRGGFGIGQSLSSRYVSFTILGIIGIYCVLAHFFFYSTKIKLVKCLFAFFTIILVIGVILGNIDGLNKGYQIKNDRNEQANILLHYSNISDSQLMRLYPIANRIREDAPILEKVKYNVFYK